MEDRLVIYVAPWHYNFLPNRTQYIADHFAKDGPVIYIPPSFSCYQSRIRQLMSFVKRFLFITSDPARRPGFKNNISIYEPLPFFRGFDAHSLDLPFAYKKYFLWDLKKNYAAELRKCKKIVLIISRLSGSFLIDEFKRIKKTVTVVDLEDPWLELDDRLKGQEDTIAPLLRKADLITANGEKIAEMFRSFTTKKIHILQNGVSGPFFDCPAKKPDLFMKKPGRPKILFAGHINDRIDYDLIRRAASKFDQADFIFTGQINTEATFSEANIYLLGWVEFDELISYMHHSDILMIPYKFFGSKKMYPQKLLEYLATGRPVITTIAIEGSDEYVYLARNDTEFIALMEKLLKIEEDASIAKRRIAYAMDNTWQKRMSLFSGWLSALEEKPA